MSLTGRQARFLRQRAHHLKPVIMIGNAGLTPAVIEETQRTLEHHELIKVRVAAPDREQRRRTALTLSAATGADLVQVVGHVAVIYRPAEEPAIQLP